MIIIQNKYPKDVTSDILVHNLNIRCNNYQNDNTNERRI